AALRVLRLVRLLEPAEVEPDGLHEQLVALTAPVLHAADQNVLERDDVVVERLAAGFAEGQRRFREMLARAARLREDGRRSIDIFHDREIVDVDLTGTAARPALSRAQLGHPPRPREHLDFSL